MDDTKDSWGTVAWELYILSIYKEGDIGILFNYTIL